MDIELMKKNLRQETENEVKNNILKFWSEVAVDEDYGGFRGSVENDLTTDEKAPKGVILNSRILWTYSKAYNIFGDDKYLKLAKRAYEYIKDYFWDEEYGGVFWMVDYEGNPTNDKKQIYAQVFAVYGLSEYYLASKDEESLEYAIKIYNLTEKYSYDTENKGYFEAFTREWGPTDEMQLGDADMNEKKSMNTHLHILEAYTNLYKMWEDQGLKGKLEELIIVMLDYILDNSTYHFKLFFDEKWDSKSNVISYGHDIEGSWLLVEAAEVLGKEDLLNKTKEIASLMAQKTYEEGIDEDGSVINEMLEDGSLDEDRIWWVQAEAIVGFINAYQMTENEYFLKAAYKNWEYTKKHIIDNEDGEWFWSVSKDGSVSDEYLKVDPWKCPYHNSRACFEIIERIK